MFHGGNPPLRRDPDPDVDVAPPVQSSGYRNLFGALTVERGERGPRDAVRGFGFTKEEQRKTDDLMVKLGKRLERPFFWPDTLGGATQPEDNPGIPSGYVYLAQLMAHDLTFNASTVPAGGNPVAEGRNLREAALNLETIYGGGPLETPLAYVPEARSGTRYRLRVGRVRDGGNRPPTGAGNDPALERDIPRTCPVAGERTSPDSELPTEALIADPRNDDHLLISQLVVLFHLLHNRVCDALEGGTFATPEAIAAVGRNHLLFAAARRVVTAVYRSVIRDDLAAKLLAGDVFDLYRARGFARLDGTEGASVPVEFAHAALRLGHAMVRQLYDLRDGVLTLDVLMLATSTDLPGQFPLSWPWVVRWSRFFALEGGAPPNLSRRIGPSYEPALVRSQTLRLDGEGLSKDAVERVAGLPRRDQVRGGSTYMRSVASLIERVEALAPPGFLAGYAFRDPEARAALVRDFLSDPALPAEDGRPPEALTSAEVDLLAEDPPLLLFLMLEAAREQGGRRVGTLGSIILAEGIFPAVVSSETAEVEGVLGTGTLLGLAFPNGAPATMADVIRFVGASPALQGAEPAFI